MSDAVDLAPGAVVVDVGGGHGRLLRTILENCRRAMNPGGTVVAVEMVLVVDGVAA